MLASLRQFQGSPLKSTTFKAAKFRSWSATSAHCNQGQSNFRTTLPSWVSDNKLYQRHPRLHYLENHCKSLHQLKKVLSYIFVSGLRRNPFIMSRVLYLCLHELEGDVEMKSCVGVQVFDQIDEPTAFSWNTIIRFFAVSDDPQRADSITFIAMLSACAHSGLVQEGLCIFESMKARYGIEPDLKHYGCIIDLFGKAGMLEKAYEIVETMPMEPNLTIWGSLLSACRIHKNVDLGEIVSRKIKSLSGRSGGTPVLLSNIYANENRWSEVIHIRKGMRAEVLEKTPGQSWIQVKDTVHEFVVGDKSYPEAVELCMLLEGLERLGKAL